MTDQPTAETIDITPWEEPRPPHLPDAVTTVSPWVFLFVVLAVLQVVAGWLEWKAQGDLGDPTYGAWIAVGVVQAACVSLLGAALFLRHPDAHRRLPMLVAGVVLLVATVLLSLVVEAIDEPLQTNELPMVRVLYGYGFNIVSAVGLIYVARGLDRARRLPDVVSGRGLGLALTAAVVLAAVASVLPGGTPWAGDVLWFGNVVALLLSVFVTLAWCYLLVIAFRGWRADEQPRLGWLLVVVAAGISVADRLLISVSGWLDLSAYGSIVLWAISLAFVSVWVLLLLAFLIGLPSTASEPEPTADQQATTPPGSGAG